MNNNDKIENTLRSAVSNAVPDVLGGIMDACDQQKGKVIYMEKKKNNTLRSVAAIAAVFVLLIAGIFLAKNFQGGSSGTLAAVVSFDVNPSIELSVDKNEKVLSAAGLNDDGREVLDGMELKDTDLDVAVNAIVGSMLQHGYLDDMANSILLSVSGVDGYDADTLQAKLTESVNKLLKDCSVLSQNVSDADSDLVEKADKYGITVGKAKLITEIVASDSRHNFEELVGLTINELNLIAEKADAQGILGIGREDVHGVSAHAEGAAHQVIVIAVVLDVYELADEVVPFQGDLLVHVGRQARVVLRAADAVDAGDRRYHDDVATREQ